jgi:hypothetical protein
LLAVFYCLPSTYMSFVSYFQSPHAAC